MKFFLITMERPVHDVKPITVHNNQNGGEAIEAGTLHGGEAIEAGTLHGGEAIEPGTLHGGEAIEAGTLHGGEAIEAGTLHGINETLIAGTLCASYSPATYRTKDGTSTFKFRYIDMGGKFEIDILEQPSYRNRDTSAVITHRLPSERGGKKICISAGKEPGNLEKAKKISIDWAELTHNYILTGKTIDYQISHRTNDAKSFSIFSWLFN